MIRLVVVSAYFAEESAELAEQLADRLRGDPLLENGFVVVSRVAVPETALDSDG